MARLESKSLLVIKKPYKREYEPLIPKQELYKFIYELQELYLEGLLQITILKPLDAAEEEAINLKEMKLKEGFYIDIPPTGYTPMLFKQEAEENE